VHLKFAQDFRAKIEAEPGGFTFPAMEPMPGERLVMNSFSAEWAEYDFDGVMWELDYEDHETRFLNELGKYSPATPGGTFLEVGCGLGVTTYLAHKNYQVDAVGVDLSLAAKRAASRYGTNPFLHFVQASVFYLPFEERTFQTVYSRGVLHHTYSTQEAFKALASYCSEGGSLYIWVYGPGSITDNGFRRGLHLAERMGRRVLSGRSGRWSMGLLAPLALGYMAFNRLRRRRNPQVQAYNFRRALHAARDRFTPEYAHRQDHREVARWFREAGFENIEVVDWRTMPPADHDDYRRNTGVRGKRWDPADTSEGIR
jgi:SAM-dependent methyltransferase